MDSFDALLSTRIDEVVERKLRLALAGLAPVDAGERLLTIPAAAERAAVGPTTLRRWISEGRLSAVPIPGRIPGRTELRVRAADLDAFILGLAGDRRPGPIHNGRKSRPTKTKRTPTAAQPSLDELVKRRIERAGGSQSPRPHTKTARQSREL